VSKARRAAAAAPPAPTGFAARWNAFFFAARDPRLCSVLRIGFAVLVLVDALVLLPDLGYWFSDGGVMPAANARLIINEDAFTLLHYVPLQLGYALLVAHAVLLLVGWQSRIQALGVLIWLVSFQHRNYAIVDGEDTVMRLFAFYLALCPCGWAFSLDAWLRRRGGKPELPPPTPWALRLFQLQMCVIYLSSAFEKSTGADWISGKALYYVARLDDSFGKFPVPAYLFEHLWLVKLMTWSVLVIEWLLPVALWWRRHRKAAVLFGIVFHLSIEYTMNLFLFHWLMILGLVSFLEFDDLPFAKRARPASGP